MEAGNAFPCGMLVWAKMPGYPYWPALIVSPPEGKTRASSKYVIFFGSKDYAWVKISNLLQYEGNQERFSNARDSKLKVAIKAIQGYYEECDESMNELINDCTNPQIKDNIRVRLLVEVSDAAMVLHYDEIDSKKLKRKEKAGEDSTQSSPAPKKRKRSLSKEERKEPKRTENPRATRLQVSKQKKTYTLAKYARKEPKRTGKKEANKSDLKKNTSRKNPAESCKAPKKLKVAASTKDLQKGPKKYKKLETNNKTGMETRSSKRNSVQPSKGSAKPKTSASDKNSRREPKRLPKTQVINKTGMETRSSKRNSVQPRKASAKPKTSASDENSRREPKRAPKPQAINKTGMEKRSSKRNSVQPRKTSAKPKTSASDENSRREQKRAPKPQAIVKRSKIVYLPSCDSSFVFPGPSTSSRVPEIANGRIMYDINGQGRNFIRGHLQPAQLTLGFVGIGELAFDLVSNLVRAGKRVIVWNRTESRCSDLVELGAIQAETPEDVAAESDIVFCTVRGIGAITEVCFGGFYVDNGIVKGLKRNPRRDKGFVMLSSIRPETSLIIAQDFKKVNTMYLEAQVILKSNKSIRDDCDMKIICAGNKKLFEKLPTCLASTKAQCVFISSMLGEASRMKYAHTVTHVGSALSLIEAIAVIQESECPVPLESLMFILDEWDNTSYVLRNKIREIIIYRKDTAGTIRELKDTLRELYEWYPKKPLPVATASYEALGYASRKGADNYNISAMYDLLV